jgi:GlpG protein
MSINITALSVDLNEDILPLSAVLHQRGVAHKIYEENGRQVLAVEHDDKVEEVNSLYRAWRSGELRIDLVKKQREAVQSSVAAWRKAPVTMALIVLSVCGFALVYFPFPAGWLSELTFTPYAINGTQIEFSPQGGEIWRFITPAFLHFGWLHIVFNCLWLWDLGVRVERVMGSLDMLLLFLVIALVSNTAQFVFGGPGIFGGMSGVVYGLLGFSWAGAYCQPAWLIKPPNAVMLFMVGWLVLCVLGVVGVLGFGAVANAAHVAGLVVGVCLGVAFGLLSRTYANKGK